MMTAVDLKDCYFNWMKGMWETDPRHWVHARGWVNAGFPTATHLDRGVRHNVFMFRYNDVLEVRS